MLKSSTRCATRLYLHLGWLVIVSFVSCNVHSQHPKIDSLNSLLKSRTGQEYFSVLTALGYEYLVSGNYEEAIRKSDQLLTFGTQLRDSLQISRALAIKASVLRRTGSIDSALLLYELVYPIARRNEFEEEVKNVTNSLGLLYLYQGNYDKALKYLFESLSIREARGDKLDISVVLQNVGLVYYKLRDFQKALSFFEKANDLRVQVKTDLSREILLLNISLCHSNQSNFVEAKRFINEAFVIGMKNDSSQFLCHAYFALGFMSFKQENFIAAEEHFLKSYFLSKIIKDTRLQLDNVIHLSNIYLDGDKIVLAERYLKEAEALINKDSKYKKELLGIYDAFSNLYHRTKNYHRVTLYQDKLLTLKDSIFNDEMTTNLMKAEADYAEKENRLKIEAQLKILELNNEVMFRQNMLNAFMGVIAFLLIILASILARNNQLKQIANRRLDDKVKERTEELQSSRDAFKRAWQQRMIKLDKAALDIRSLMATMKGLCVLGIKDIDHPKAALYLTKLDEVSNQLSDVLNPVLYSNRRHDLPSSEM